MTQINENIYHIHQYHLNTNFMAAPRRQQITRRRQRNTEIELDATGATINAALQMRSVIEQEDVFHEVNLESEAENFPNHNGIENKNYGAHNIGADHLKSFLPGLTYPPNAIHTSTSVKGHTRKRMRQWSDNDLYLPEMRQYFEDKQNTDVHKPSTVTFRIGDGYTENRGNREDRLSNTLCMYMGQINKELDKHSHQIINVSKDVQQLYQVIVQNMYVLIIIPLISNLLYRFHDFDIFHRTCILHQNK